MSKLQKKLQAIPKPAEGAMKRRKISDEILDLAKARYMEYVPLSEVAREVGVSRSSLQYYAKNFWAPERELLKNELISNMVDSQKHAVTSISRAAIKTMERCLVALSTRPDPPSTRESLDAMKILEALDRLTRSPDLMKDDNEDVSEIDLMAIDPFAVTNITNEDKNDSKTE